MKERNFIQKCYSRLRACWLPYFYKYKKCRIGVNTTEVRKKKIIISLTSFPARFPNLYICIKSLLNQTLKPDHIILYLGKDSTDVKLPSSLLKLQKYGLQIVRGVDDIKPHKKYFYAMKAFPDDIIITVDDDCVYDDNLVKDLYFAHLKFPNTVVARNVRVIPAEMSTYDKWKYKSDLVMSTSFCYLAVGLGGVLYPPHILSEECFNLNNIKALCLTADDIWLKYHELLNSVTVTHCPSIYYMPVILKESTKVSLFHKNLGDNKNDKFIREVGKYYNINIFGYGD